MATIQNFMTPMITPIFEPILQPTIGVVATSIEPDGTIANDYLSDVYNASLDDLWTQEL